MSFRNIVRLLFATLALVNSSAHALQMGTIANAQQATGIVGISYEDDFRNCIGILLQADRVLTTVSCVQNIQISFPASSIRVHPLSGLEIGGTSFVPTLNDSVTPFVGVSQVIKHPQNTSSSGGGPFNLAILVLSSPINMPVARLYNGNQSVVGMTADAFGWREFTRNSGFLPTSFYEANVLGLPAIVDGDDDFNSISDGCYDSFVDTDTVICAGFRNQSQFLESDDRGGPLYIDDGNGPVVVGLLSRSSGGIEFDGIIGFEEFANVSVMSSFIEANAVNTNFVDSLSSNSTDPDPTPDPGSGPSVPFAPIVDLIINE